MKQYLEVKDAHVHHIGRLAVGQEGHMVEDAAHRPVRGRRFGLGGQGRSIWVDGPVQVSHQTISNQGYYTVITPVIPGTSQSQPLCCQAFPEGDASVAAAGQDPGVRRSLGVRAHAHVSVQAKAQQEAAQQGGVILTVALRTDSVSCCSGSDLLLSDQGLICSSLTRTSRQTATRSRDLSTSVLLLKEVNMAPTDVRTFVCLLWFSHNDKQKGWCCSCKSFNALRHFQVRQTIKFCRQEAEIK